MLTVEMRGSVKNRCDGCKWQHLPRPSKPEEPHYCSNPKSIWYLRTTGARCNEFDFREE